MALSVHSGPLVMTIVPELGGRVQECAFAGKNLLSGPEVHQDNWGATYWTSPQADWGWPPVAAVDSEPYVQTEPRADGVVSLTSAAARIGQRHFRIEKRFVPRQHGCIDTEYSIVNLGEEAFSMASWEISRVPPGGLTFFPSGARVLTPIPPHAELLLQDSEGVSFYDHSTFEPGLSRKVHADGSEGFLAHLQGDLLVLKVFVDTPPERQAPGEGEVEIFANFDGRYVEVEVQGAYETIAPLAKSSWVVRTRVVVVPAAQRQDLEALVALARAAVAEMR
jgi:hypothetical protein